MVFCLPLNVFLILFCVWFFCVLFCLFVELSLGGVFVFSLSELIFVGFFVASE